MVKKQTAGRKQLGDFAPKFAELNDDVLFGQVWAREDKLFATNGVWLRLRPWLPAETLNNWNITCK